METIITMVIDESDNISLDLLSPLLACVRKENETVSPISWKLGEKVITNWLLSFNLISKKQCAL